MIGSAPRRSYLFGKALIVGALVSGAYLWHNYTKTKEATALAIKQAEAPIVELRTKTALELARQQNIENGIINDLKKSDAVMAESAYVACVRSQCIPADRLARLGVTIAREKPRIKRDSIESVKREALRRVQELHEEKLDSLDRLLQKAFDADNIDRLKTLYPSYLAAKPDSEANAEWKKSIANLSEKKLGDDFQNSEYTESIVDGARRYLKVYPQGPRTRKAADALFKEEQKRLLSSINDTFNDRDVDEFNSFGEDLAVLNGTNVPKSVYTQKLQDAIASSIEKGSWQQYERDDLSKKLINATVRVHIIGKNFSEEVDSIREAKIPVNATGTIVAIVDDYALVSIPGKTFAWPRIETPHYTRSYDDTSHPGISAVLQKFGNALAPFMSWELERRVPIDKETRSYLQQASKALSGVKE